MIVILALFFLMPFAYAGNELGNGGDAFAQEFVSIGRGLVDELKKHPNPNIGDVNALEAAVSSTHVETKDALELRAAEVDAINYPEKKRIELSRKRWKDYSPKQKTALVLHEYLGIAQTNDKEYQVSSAYAEAAFMSDKPRLEKELQVRSGFFHNSSFHDHRFDSSDFNNQRFKNERPSLGIYFGHQLNQRWRIGASYDNHRKDYETKGTFQNPFSYATYLHQEYLHINDFMVSLKALIKNIRKLSFYAMAGLGASAAYFETHTHYYESSYYGPGYDDIRLKEKQSFLLANLALALEYRFVEAFSLNLLLDARQRYAVDKPTHPRVFSYGALLGLSYLL